MQSSIIDGGHVTRGEQYTDPASLWSCLERGEVILLRSSWVLNRAASGQPMPCRQQIEAEHRNAIITAAELSRLHDVFTSTFDACTQRELANGKIKPPRLKPVLLPVLTISHPWHAREHPDLELVTLRAIVSELKRLMNEHFGPWGLAEIGIFFDYSSLYQNKPHARTPWEENLFQQALQNMAIWYAHEATFVFLVDSPKALPPHEQRGWCSFERAVMQLGKNDSYACDPFLVERFGCPATIPHKITKIGDRNARASVPLSPDRFDEMLLCKTFTNGTDCAIVQKLYRSTIQDMYAVMTVFDMSRLGWGDTDAVVLADTIKAVTLPHVRLFSLYGNAIADNGVTALCASLRDHACPNLEKLQLAENCLGAPAAAAIADLLRSGAVPRIRSLNIGRNEVGAIGANLLGSALPSTLETISMHSNKLGSAGVHAIASSLCRMPKLKEIVLGHNEAGDDGAQALGSALRGRTLDRVDFRDNGLTSDGEHMLLRDIPNVSLGAR